MSGAEHDTDGRRARLTIDLDAVAANYARLAAEAGAARCAAVVKADGYGLGAARVAPVLAAAGSRDFFVATFDEAERLAATLRAAFAPGSDAYRIYILNGPLPGGEMDIAEQGFIPVLNSRQQIDAWRTEAGRQGRALPAIVHVDTGMARLGLQLDDTAGLDADALEGIEILYVMSHLACAEDAGNPMNASQRRAFETARAALPAAKASLANSSGIFLGPDFHYDLVRPGCALYGVNPTPEQASPIRPVVTLTAPIIQTRRVDKPQTVGYGATWQAQRPTRVATIAFGYADGYPRHLSSKGHCFIADHRVPVIGRVSMDLITLDVSDVPDDLVKPGAGVEILGLHQDVDAFAGIAGTIGYEVLTNLATGVRIERVYVGGEV